MRWKSNEVHVMIWEFIGILRFCNFNSQSLKKHVILKCLILYITIACPNKLIVIFIIPEAKLWCYLDQNLGVVRLLNRIQDDLDLWRRPCQVAEQLRWWQTALDAAEEDWGTAVRRYPGVEEEDDLDLQTKKININKKNNKKLR